MNLNDVRMRRPREVRIAAALILGVIALNVAQNFLTMLVTARGVQSSTFTTGGVAVLYVALAFNALFFWGIWNGKALAMQLVRLLYPLGILNAGLEIFSAFSMELASREVAFVSAWAALRIPLLLLAFIYVGRPASRAFFNVTCHKCNSSKTRAGSFLYTSSKCRDCGHTWKHNERPDRLPVSATA